MALPKGKEVRGWWFQVPRANSSYVADSTKHHENQESWLLFLDPIIVCCDHVEFGWWLLQGAKGQWNDWNVLLHMTQ